MKNLVFAILSLLFVSNFSFAQERTDVYARNIIIVFDASGSMEDSISSDGGRIQKITAAKNAVRKVLAALPSNTNIGLFVFGNVRNNNPVTIGPKNDILINEAIAGISAGGGTPLGEYIQKAANQLLLQREKNLGYGWYQLIVVTDGEANDKGHMDNVAKEVLRRGLSIDVIGVGMSSTHSLAKRSTSYRAANDAAALDKALQEVTAETGSNSSANNDDFELISWLSEDQAKTIISTLGNTENQPLFEKPKLSQVVTEQATPVVAIQQNQKVEKTGNNIVEIVLGLFVVVIVILFLALLARN